MITFFTRISCFFLAFMLLPFHFSSSKNIPVDNLSPDVSDYNVCAEEACLSLNCKSAVLMEATTGTILYTQNADQALPPASVTKVMTLLLVMEAIDSGKLALDEMITASEYATGMGGSQIYLKEGEQMSVEDLLKSVVISSANDAAVALAERVAGDVDNFVKMMNEKAKDLGMKSTHFENVTGLDDTVENHLTSAHDIAIMSKELISHPTILKYSSIWMDSIRGGAFGLTNTNRLIRFYRGATGLKTGSTSKAGFCITVTAERDGLSLICVIMGAETRDIRNAQATHLLDWGFSNYAMYDAPSLVLDPIQVKGGTAEKCDIERKAFSCVIKQEDKGKIKEETKLPDQISAPILEGDPIGKVEYYVGDNLLGKIDIVSKNAVPKINYWGLWKRMLSRILFM